jgi:hypothetical protein
MLQRILQSLPATLRDRLFFLRRTYPDTPLQSLPDPVRAEVKHILTHAGATNGQPSTTHRPVLQGQRQGTPPNGTQRPARHSIPRPTDSSILGTDSATGGDVLIGQERRQGVYILGQNGTGKSVLLLNMIMQDIHAYPYRGLCVVEPHGDLVHQILSRIPQHRINDVIYLDVEDVEQPFGLGLFEVPQPRTMKSMAATASFISHLWETLWNSGFETPRLMQNLRATTRTLLANPGSSFADIPLLYSSETVRATMLEQVDNPNVLQFWENYERMNQRDRQAFTESTLNKVTAFLDEPMISHILSQARTTIPFRYIMDNAKILLIKLSPQYEEASRLIGTVIIGKILMTAFSRADTPNEDNRRDFSLYVDEVQRFQSSDFATLISEARKFRISTCISHQQLTQVSEQIRASFLASGTLICFRVSGDDGHVLCRAFDTTPTTKPYIIGEEAVRAPTNDTINFLRLSAKFEARI